MTAQIVQDYMAGVRTNAQMKTAIEQLLDIVNEIPGGAGIYGTPIVIASDVLQIVDSFSQFIIDGQSTAADDLKAINTAGTFRDGQRVSLSIADIGRPITFKHNVAVTNKLIMLGGADYVARSVNERLTFEYKESATAFYQIQPDYTDLLKLLLGAKPQTTVTVTSNSITPVSADVAIANGANVTINNAARTNFPNGGALLLVTAGDAYVYTLAHNVGSTGRFLNRDLASIALKAGQSVLYRAVFSTTDCWQEVVRFGFDGAPTPDLTGHALHKLRCNAGETALELVPDTSGGMTVSAQSSSFNVGSSINMRYVIDTTGGAVTVTFNNATSHNYLDEWEIVRGAGTADINIVPYSGGPEYVFDDSTLTNIDNYKMQYGMSGGKVCRLLAVTGGLQIT